MMGAVAEGHRDVITIDGPAASGKSTVALRVAQRMSIPFVSSGLLYRAAARLALDEGVDPADDAAVVELLAQHDVRLEPRVDGNRIHVDDVDVTSRLHTDAVDASVSAVAAHPAVRDWVSEQLRALSGPFVVEGRDMGTRVFPDAKRKFYLTASAEERARRRVGERTGDLGEVAAAIRRRDALDARQLEPAEDAFHIDTDGLRADEVVDRVLARAGRVGGASGPR